MPDENAFQKDPLAFQDDAFQDETTTTTQLQYLRAALEEQSRRNRYRTRYRTFGRSE